MAALRRRTILTFTGGGLAPALNATLAGVISEAQKNGYRILGGLYGWACLGRNGKVIDLTSMKVHAIESVGGTFLHSSRTNPYANGGLDTIQERIHEHKIDGIVAIGGNDTLNAARQLSEHGIAIVGVPKTIDNDLRRTYWTPGYPTAARLMADFTRQIRDDAAYALSRIFLIESPGRESGWLAAAAAMGGADVIVPPERPANLRTFLKVLNRRYERNGNFAVAVIAEHAKFDDPRIRPRQSDQRDDFGVVRYGFITIGLRDVIKAELGIDTKALVPANWFESGAPIAVDQKMAEALGRHAVKLIAGGKTGIMVAIRREGASPRLTVGELPLEAAVMSERLLDGSYFDFERFYPRQKFFDYLAPAFPRTYRARDRSYLSLIKRVNGGTVGW